MSVYETISPQSPTFPQPPAANHHVPTQTHCADRHPRWSENQGPTPSGSSSTQTRQTHMTHAIFGAPSGTQTLPELRLPLSISPSLSDPHPRHHQRQCGVWSKGPGRSPLTRPYNPVAGPKRLEREPRRVVFSAPPASVHDDQRSLSPCCVHDPSPEGRGLALTFC